MRIATVCSGIGAPEQAWASLGWQPVFHAEIEPFPSSVFATHFPDSVNLGDMTKYHEWPDCGPVDVLCAGTPCQSFSVAGLRKGLDDPRGNLTLAFLGVIERIKPRYVVWENVPGILSDDTDALKSFLDGLELLGYVCDVEILDAQYFGLAQRRRRIFICAQDRNDLLNQRTDSSALTIMQCLLEILHGICIAGYTPFASVRASSKSASLTEDGVGRRMKLFGLLEEPSKWPTLLKRLEEAAEKFLTEQGRLDSRSGEPRAAGMEGGGLMGSKQEGQSTVTEWQWRQSLEDAFQVAKLFITSTATKTITPREIFICSKAALNIAKLIVRLNPSYPPFWSAASSALTALQDFTNYARFASEDLFERMGWILPWGDFISEAEPTSQSLGSIGVESFSTILPLRESLCGNPAPSREKREGIAAPVAGCSNGGGANGPGRTADDAESLVVAGTLGRRGVRSHTEIDGHGAYVPECSPAIKACDYKGPSSDGDGDGAPLIPEIARSVAAERDGYNDGSDQTYVPVAFYPTGGSHGVCASQDCSPAVKVGSGLEIPSSPAIAFKPAFYGRGNRPSGAPDVISGTLNHSPKQGDTAPHVFQPTTLAVRGRGDESNLETRDDGTANAILTPNGGRGGIGVGAIQSAMAVRRLTPRECERLQGFPDDYTRIPWRGKPSEQCPDGPRYCALGNSMAVPVMRWIGQRIALIDSL